MKKRALPFAITVMIASQSSAFAESFNAQNQAQDALLAKQQTPGAPIRDQKMQDDLADKRDAASGDDHRSWYRHIEIAGLIEIDASVLDPYAGKRNSDVRLSTFELGITSQVNEWIKATASLLYEQDETNLEIDVASITLANTDVTPMFVTAGQIYVPFGVYKTNLVSDPLPLELGETRETALQLGFVKGDISGSAYVFHGDHLVNGEDQIGSWGASLSYAHEQNDRAWSFGVGYINDLGGADTLREVIHDNRVAALEADSKFGSDPIAGWTVNAAAVFGKFNLIGEYLAATDDFDAHSLEFRDQNARPSAWNIETGVSFPIMRRKSIASVSYQGTRESLALELPRARWSVGWSVEIFAHTSVALECAHDIDYSKADGGTGNASNRILAQLAVEF